MASGATKTPCGATGGNFPFSIPRPTTSHHRCINVGGGEHPHIGSRLPLERDRRKANHAGRDIQRGDPKPKSRRESLVSNKADPFHRKENQKMSTTDAAGAEPDGASNRTNLNETFVDADFNGNNWDQVRMKVLSRRLRSKVELYAALQWMLSLLHDPYTRFIPPVAFSTFNESLIGSQVSIGASIRVRPRRLPLLLVVLLGDRQRRPLELYDVNANGPAAKVGLRDGDLVIAVDGRPTAKMALKEAEETLQGDEGSTVELIVRRDRHRPSNTDEVDSSQSWFGRLREAMLRDTIVVTGNERVVSLRRENVKVDSVFAETVVVKDRQGSRRVCIGFLRVKEWSKSTFKETLEALRKFDSGEGIDRVVIDLRGNSGGVLVEAIEFARLFVGEKKGAKLVNFITRGKVVTTEMSSEGDAGRLWERMVRRFRRRNLRTAAERMPIVVLVDGMTASASELVAAALRDNCRAVLVGTTTFGKSSIQAVVHLEDGAAYAFTVAKYTTPHNRIIDGLEPDIHIDYLPRGKAAVTNLFPRIEKRLQQILSNCQTPS